MSQSPKASNYSALSESSIMSFREATDIAAAFGKLVVELSDTKRFSLADHRKKLPYSLPIQRLQHSKLQIQIALAIIIAKLSFELAVRRAKQSGENSSDAAMASGDLQYLRAIIIASGKLEFFSRNPLPFSANDDSVYVYEEWRETCERRFADVVGQQPELVSPDNWPSPQSHAEYWRVIDSLVSKTLDHPVLVAARDT